MRGLHWTLARWTLRAARRPWWVAGAVAAIWLASGIYSVDRGERGVVMVFGEVTRDSVPPGLHVTLPAPLARVVKVDTATTHTMSVGFRLRDKVLDIPTPAAESRWLTGDMNIIEVRAMIQYRAADPARYLLATERPDELVRRAGEVAVTEEIGRRAVDEVLTRGRGQLIADCKRRIQQLLDDWGTGIVVASVTFEALDPPREVVDAFHDVQSAQADAKRASREADGYANTVLPQARGEAAEMLAAAGSERQERISGARGWCDRFDALRAAYRAAPRETRSRLYLETAERVLADAQITVIDPQTSGERQRTVLVMGAPPAAAEGDD